MAYRPPGSSIYGIFQARILAKWSDLPFPAPGNLPDPGIKPRSPASQAYSLPSEPLGKITLYMENPKDATPKLLELINEFSKFEGYKIKIQKYLLHSCTLKTNYHKEKLRKQSHLQSHQRNTKEAKDLYSENCKTLI